MQSQGGIADETGSKNHRQLRRKVQLHVLRAFGLLVAATLVVFALSIRRVAQASSHTVSVPLNVQEILSRCRALNSKPGPPPDFYARRQSDRFVPGTNPVLFVNATVWTGEDDGMDVFSGDVLLDKGLIKWIGRDSSTLKTQYDAELEILDAHGLWLTPGIIDVHSHLAVGSAPSLRGARDGNSLKGPVQPWLRSIDGLNTHDEGLRLAVAGGLTTSLILPGSADAIGGQAFVIKLRPTQERSPTSLLLEPPYGLNGTSIDYTLPPRWRHMKHACGENPARVYQQTRMDSVWQTRQIYNKARQIKNAQDEYCAKAREGDWKDLGHFPEELQWEAAVDILRGHVKVQTHCYEAVDLDDFVRLSNEFQFPIAAFHHAHETYLVPDVLKRAYGDRPPASAMFATFARYKREAYRHSEFAPKILNDHGLRVVMKSDHAAIVSRYLLHEAQQAHYYGLPANVALRSVISTAADVLGLDHRIGFIREGYDADVVLWDSYPLQLGATPAQVFIDGIPQLDSPHVVTKPDGFQAPPRTPDFDHEAADTVKYEGLPPLELGSVSEETTVVFTNVTSVWSRNEGTIMEAYSATGTANSGVVVARSGRILCAGERQACSSYISETNLVVLDLEGGSIAPGLVSYGTNLGLQEIAGEASTRDGEVYDLFFDNLPQVAGRHLPLICAVDGLQFATRDALLAARAGVTSAITPPSHSGFLSGLSAFFSTAAPHRLAKGAVIQDVAALHVSVGHMLQPSVSTQIAALRRFLLHGHKGEHANVLVDIHQGKLPLVIDVHSADAIATILAVKGEVEQAFGVRLKITLTGATEAHLLAKELADANVGVIVNPVRPFPYAWETRRILPGPPLSRDSAIVHLLSHNVTVGLGVQGIELGFEESTWSARNARFDVSWAAIESGGRISKAQALALASTNVEKLLGISDGISQDGDLVVTKGGDLLDLQSKVVGIISPRREVIELI